MLAFFVVVDNTCQIDTISVFSKRKRPKKKKKRKKCKSEKIPDSFLKKCFIY